MEKDNKENGRAAESLTRVFSATDNQGGDMRRPARDARLRNVPPRKDEPDYLKVILLVLVVLTAAAIITLLAVHAFYRPAVDTGTPFDTGGSITTEVPPATDPANTGDVTDEPVVTDPPSVPGVTYTRNKDSINFLVLGMDKMSASTDVVMVVNFNTATNNMSIVQIPRDTYIECSDGKTGRVNAIYAHFVNLSPDSMTAKEQRRYAMEKTVESIEQGLCIQIDYYALIFLDAFKETVDAMGGVEIEIPFDMYYVDDTPGQELYIDLKAGKQVLNGDKAEQFIRFRSGYLLADISRMDAQKMFISAMLKQLKSSLSVTTAVNIAKSVLDNLTTDISIADAQYYVTKLFNVDLSKMTMVTMAGDGCRTGTSGAWMYVISRSAALDTVNTYLNVYNEDITEEIFDSAKRLTNTDDDAMMAIYNSDMSSKPVSGENAGDIYIPH